MHMIFVYRIVIQKLSIRYLSDNYLSLVSYLHIMAGKTATVLARVDPELKMKAEDILDRLGVPASLLINMLYRQIVMTKSIPFDIRIPMDSGELCIEPPTGE